MAAVNGFVGLYHLSFFAKRRAVAEYLPFALLCFAVGGYDLASAGLYSADSLSQGVAWQHWQLLLIPCIAIILIWFTARFTDQRLNLIPSLLIGWFALLLLILPLLPDAAWVDVEHPQVKHIQFLGFPEIVYFEGGIGWWGQVAILTAMGTYLYLCILFISHYRRTRERTVLVIFASQVAYFAAAINDSLVGLGIYPFLYVSEYAFFLIVLSMAYALLVRFVDLHHAFETLNRDLERKVEERTRKIVNLNEHLKRLAERDGLTGIYNRRFFNEYLDIEVRRARSHIEHLQELRSEPGMRFALAIVDLDCFKQINDTFGHPAGDRALREVATIMSHHLFGRDVLCRYGGDEFAILFTNTDQEGMKVAMEKIRREIEAFALEIEGKPPLRLSISAGMVHFDETQNLTSDQILIMADERLLQAKRQGRNQVVA